MVRYVGVANSWRIFWTGFYLISELLEQLKHSNLAWSVLIVSLCPIFKTDPNQINVFNYKMSS